ncbi:MAG: peptidoglycan-binding protein [Rhodobacterales bacterium]|nr:MAG: peptidoglycan-binding protein [Rhodobacterales bacterium]
MRSVVAGLKLGGATAGLNLPHRLAQFLPQAAHESGRFKYDREVWGPTPAQRRYDIRVDLGNTPERDGDGYSKRGRGPFQLTGGHNYRAFSAWAKDLDPDAPDFFRDPDALNTDPWEGLSAIWYWDEGNPTGQSLNRYADRNDIEMVTHRINGGLNGYADRLRLYDRTALVLLGRDPSDIRGFQAQADVLVDGISGPITRAAMHRELVALPSLDEEQLDIVPDRIDRVVDLLTTSLNILKGN